MQNVVSSVSTQISCPFISNCKPALALMARESNVLMPQIFSSLPLEFMILLSLRNSGTILSTVSSSARAHLFEQFSRASIHPLGFTTQLKSCIGNLNRYTLAPHRPPMPSNHALAFLLPNSSKFVPSKSASLISKYCVQQLLLSH